MTYKAYMTYKAHKTYKPYMPISFIPPKKETITIKKYTK